MGKEFFEKVDYHSFRQSLAPKFCVQLPFRVSTVLDKGEENFHILFNNGIQSGNFAEIGTSDPIQKALTKNIIVLLLAMQWSFGVIQINMVNYSIQKNTTVLNTPFTIKKKQGNTGKYCHSSAPWKLKAIYILMA
ncbi:MAG: hypothetical protein PHG08_07320 [Bacilli bacterium]|nr:hypothetical protein [Bacilli bacterium]HHU23932.1 hypothetical protein [Acholeplasmataceae bacterium]